MILGFGEMREEDKPPEAIWLDEPALIKHFEERKTARDADKPGGDDTGPWGNDWGGDGELVQNKLADEMLQRAGVK